MVLPAALRHCIRRFLVDAGALLACQRPAPRGKVRSAACGDKTVHGLLQ